VDRPEWIPRAVPLETVYLDVGFLVSKDFYYGPENDFTPEQYQGLRNPLYQPQLKRYGDFVLSEAIESSAAELIRYYQDVLLHIDRYHKNVKQQGSYFWMRPILYSSGVFAGASPWYDTWEEATSLLVALTSTEEGEVFWDYDQGWQFEVFAEADRIYLRDSDPDYGEERYVIAVDRSNLAAQASEVRRRGSRVLQELVAGIGRDFWTRGL